MLHYLSFCRPAGRQAGWGVKEKYWKPLWSCIIVSCLQSVCCSASLWVGVQGKDKEGTHEVKENIKIYLGHQQTDVCFCHPIHTGQTFSFSFWLPPFKNLLLPSLTS